MKFRFIYRGLKAKYRDQRVEIKAIINALQKDEIAIDVGANKGSYLWGMSRAVPDGKVIAFEPQPTLANYLKTACPVTGMSNVVIEAVGVSGENGMLTLAIPGGGESSPGASFESKVKNRESCRTVEVPVHSLDSYFSGEKNRIGAIKIDVEGHELSVLQGAQAVITKHSPLIVCECESRHMTEGDVFSVLDYFKSFSYDGFFVHRSRLVPVSEFDKDKHQREIGDRFWDSKDYCNNFIMRKTS